MKRTKRVLALLLVVCLAMSLMPMMAMAKGKKSGVVYKDVTLKKVDAQSYAAIEYVKAHGGWSGIAHKGKLRPNKAVTRQEMLRVLDNMYPDKVPVSIIDFRLWYKKVTSQEVCDKMVELSAALGYKIQWTGNTAKMKRKDLARYIKIFATYNAKLAPLK